MQAKESIENCLEIFLSKRNESKKSMARKDMNSNRVRTYIPIKISANGMFSSMFPTLKLNEIERLQRNGDGIADFIVIIEFFIIVQNLQITYRC